MKHERSPREHRFTQVNIGQVNIGQVIVVRERREHFADLKKIGLRLLVALLLPLIPSPTQTPDQPDAPRDRARLTATASMVNFATANTGNAATPTTSNATTK